MRGRSEYVVAIRSDGHRCLVVASMAARPTRGGAGAVAKRSRSGRNGAPGAKGTDPDKDVPTLTVWRPRPEVATGSAVVVCPGGGYGMLAMDHEGKQVAEWLNSLGITALACSSTGSARVIITRRCSRTRAGRSGPFGRMPRSGSSTRTRSRSWASRPAGTWRQPPARTSTPASPTAEDPIERVSSRPDRMILVYPVIALATPYGHKGSLRNLLGDNPSPELVESLSNERQVTKETPPTFLAHTNADTGVPAENALLFALALRKAGVPVELHLFERGPPRPGAGRRHRRLTASRRSPSFKAWPKLCETWLKNQGFLERSGGSK